MRTPLPTARREQGGGTAVKESSLHPAARPGRPGVPLASARDRAHAAERCPSPRASAGAREAAKPLGAQPVPLRGASSPGAGELCAPLSADAQGAAPTPRTALAQVPGSLDAGGRTEPGRTGCARREKSASRSRGSPRSPEVPGPGPLPHLPDAA